jgi:hypothetical protein
MVTRSTENRLWMFLQAYLIKLCTNFVGLQGIILQPPLLCPIVFEHHRCRTSACSTGLGAGAVCNIKDGGAI